MFTYNSKGVKPSQFSDLVPEGVYTLEIMKAEESKSRNGSPMVKVSCIIEDAPYTGAPLYHYVTFLENGSTGAGIAVHFLKCIGEPYDESEALDIDPKRWIGKKFKAKVIQEKYKKQDLTEGVSNKIKSVMPAEGLPF